MIRHAGTTLLVTAALFAATSTSGQSSLARTIELCAEDGTTFLPSSALDHPGQATPVAILGLGEPGGIHLSLRYPASGDDTAQLTFFRQGKPLLTTTLNGFEGPYGWVPSVPQDHYPAEDRYIALSWSGNATVRSTKLFELQTDGSLIEDKTLIPLIERQFTTDAHRVCRNPGLNTLAVKWLDNDRLLVSINAWASGFCSSNFTEGFILRMSTRSVQRKLTERQLIDLPYVCTWNLNPADRH